MSKKRLSALIASFAFLAVSSLSAYATDADASNWVARCTVEQSFCGFEYPAYCERYGNFGTRRGTGQGRQQRFANESMRYQGQRLGQAQQRGLGAGRGLCW